MLQEKADEINNKFKKTKAKDINARIKRFEEISKLLVQLSNSL